MQTTSSHGQSFGSYTPYTSGPPSYAAASVEKRFLALILDSLYAMWPSAAAFTLLAFAVGLDSLAEASGDGLGMVALLVMVAGICWGIWYSFTKDGNERGAGFGKRVTKLMVIDVTTNRPATRGQSAKRQLVMTLLGFIPLVGWAIEPLMVLVKDDGRRVGDRAADTMVIEASEYQG